MDEHGRVEPLMGALIETEISCQDPPINGHKYNLLNFRLYTHEAFFQR